MELTFYNFNKKNIEVVTEPVLNTEWSTKLEWIDIRADNRQEVMEYLSFLNLSSLVVDNIIHPENHFLTESDSNVIIQNFVIVKNIDIYATDYITLIIFKEFVISITPESSVISINPKKYELVQKFFTNMRVFFAYMLANNIIAMSTKNMGILRSRLNKKKQQLIINPEKLHSKDVVNLLFDISTFSDIIEDQYVSIDSFTKLLINEQTSDDITKIKEIVSSIKELSRITARLEDKADSLRSQFTMIHQEETTHKINILTIMQAIFVPITFLAGLYGMNFDNMPELHWKYSYFVLLGVFALIATFQLIFFKRKGWFD